MSRDWDHARGAGAVIDRPAPRVGAEEVVRTDTRVPLRARQLDVAALRAGWVTSLHYACGNTVSGDGGVGPVVESVVLRAHRGRQRAVAFWITASLALCGDCGGLFVPLADDVFRVHGSVLERCPGGGQPARRRDVEPGQGKYAYGSAYVSRLVRVHGADGYSTWVRCKTQDELRAELMKEVGV